MWKACLGVSIIVAVMAIIMLGVGINYAIVSRRPNTFYKGPSDFTPNYITTIPFKDERPLSGSRHYTYEHPYEDGRQVAEVPKITLCFKGENVFCFICGASHKYAGYSCDR
jgi:hypothetical protein